jgi:hypothetical protein
MLNYQQKKYFEGEIKMKKIMFVFAAIVFSFININETIAAQEKYFFYSEQKILWILDLGVTNAVYQGVHTLDIKTDGGKYATGFINELKNREKTKHGILVSNTKSDNSSVLWEKSYSYRYVEVFSDKVKIYYYKGDGITMESETLVWPKDQKEIWRKLFPSNPDKIYRDK